MEIAVGENRIVVARMILLACKMTEANRSWDACLERVLEYLQARDEYVFGEGVNWCDAQERL